LAEVDFTSHSRPYAYQESDKAAAQFLQAFCLKEKIMEHIHMNHLRDLIRRLRAGERTPDSTGYADFAANGA
jgi:hypothetical protein